MKEKEKVFPNSYQESDSDFFGSNEFDQMLINKNKAKEEVLREQKLDTALVLSFLQKMHEVVPIAISGLDETTEENMRYRFLLQQKTVSTVSDRWGLGGGTVKDKYILSVVSKTASSLIRDGYLTGKNHEERMAYILDEIDRVSEKQPYFGSLIGDDLSDDVVVNVRMALFPAAIRFESILSSLKMNKIQIGKWLDWHSNMSISLSKDLAFNWDKRANIKDRERLFIDTLNHSSEIAIKGWLMLLVDTIPLECPDKRIRSVNEITVYNALTPMNELFEKMGIGYKDHSLFNVQYLKKMISDHIIKRSNSYLSQITVGHELSDYVSFIATLYVEKAKQLWLPSSEKAISKIKKELGDMSAEELERWELDEGSLPLCIEGFLEDLDDAVNDVLNQYLSTISTPELLKKCKGNLALIWGVTLAVSGIKKKGAKDD